MAAVRKLVKGLEHECNEEPLRNLGVPAEKEAQEILLLSTTPQKEAL